MGWIVGVTLKQTANDLISWLEEHHEAIRTSDSPPRFAMAAYKQEEREAVQEVRHALREASQMVVARGGVWGSDAAPESIVAWLAANEPPAEFVASWEAAINLGLDDDEQGTRLLQTLVKDDADPDFNGYELVFRVRAASMNTAREKASRILAAAFEQVGIAQRDLTFMPIQQVKPTSRVYKVGELWRWRCWCGAKGGDYHAVGSARSAVAAHQSSWSHRVKK